MCAEIGDFHRFAHAAQVMSFLGVTPSEHSSGERRRRGPTTKSGSQHARRLLVEAAWRAWNSATTVARLSPSLRPRARGFCWAVATTD
jgi:transposase